MTKHRTVTITDNHGSGITMLESPVTADEARHEILRLVGDPTDMLAELVDLLAEAVANNGPMDDLAGALGLNIEQTTV